jgi:hypothetical protein
MMTWTREHPWRFFALIWTSGVILSLLIWFLLADSSGSHVDWPAAIAVAVICPTIGSVGLAEGIRHRGEQRGKDDVKP